MPSRSNTFNPKVIPKVQCPLVINKLLSEKSTLSVNSITRSIQHCMATSSYMWRVEPKISTWVCNKWDRDCKKAFKFGKKSRHRVIPGLIHELTVIAVHTHHLVLIIISSVPSHKAEISLKQLLPQAACDFCLPASQEVEDERSQAGWCNTALWLLGDPGEAAPELDRSLRP